MPQKLKVELQDENGNVYYLHTAADVVFLEDGTTVEAALDAKVTKSGGDIADTVVYAIDASSDSFPVLKENSKPRKFLGQINKWFSDCLTKFGNYILTTAISNQQINSTTNVPSSALAYLMQQAIVANQNSINGLNTNVTDLQNRTAKFCSYYTASESDTVISALGDVWAGIPDNSCFQLFFVWHGQVASIIGSKATAYYGQMTVEGYSESLRLKYYIINGDWIKS